MDWIGVENTELFSVYKFNTTQYTRDEVERIVMNIAHNLNLEEEDIEKNAKKLNKSFSKIMISIGANNTRQPCLVNCLENIDRAPRMRRLSYRLIQYLKHFRC
jgi:hypothetical protein